MSRCAPRISLVSGAFCRGIGGDSDDILIIFMRFDVVLYFYEFILA
jgi:hypothetical protein